jgi:acetyl esterase/lipase
MMGAVGAVLGWVYDALWAVPMGIIGAGWMTWYVWRCTRDHNGFEKAFGAGWSDQIMPQQARNMVKRRWSLFLKMKASPEPVWERDIPFWTIPDTDRQLLCDIWRPADGNVSGLAYVFLHGSAWAIGNKDMLTRPFFRHLVAQGHTVMDVAYRLIPEVDIYGMVGDAKRAVAWIKANADHYGVDPEKIVLGGGSAGAHIALLAGYTPEHPELTPEELKGADLSVCGMLTYYPPTDLVAGAKRYNYNRKPPVPLGTKVDPKNPMLYAGRLDILLGGYPEDVPDMYQLACPTTHVHHGSPPTLSLRGARDCLNPVEGNQELYAKLVESGVPAIDVVYPWTEHAFDLLLPQVNPAAQSALYDVDRFLALMVNKD